MEDDRSPQKKRDEMCPHTVSDMRHSLPHTLTFSTRVQVKGPGHVTFLLTSLIGLRGTVANFPQIRQSRTVRGAKSSHQKKSAEMYSDFVCAAKAPLDVPLGRVRKTSGSHRPWKIP